MIRLLLVEKQFRFFVQRLVYTWQYSNLSTEDFLDTLKKEDDGEEIASVVESWIYSSDLPKIMVQLVKSDEKGNLTIKLTRKKSACDPHIPINLYAGTPKKEGSCGNS